MTFDDWWKENKQYAQWMDINSWEYTRTKQMAREAYLAGQRDIVGELNLPSIIFPAAITYVLCERCDIYHPPDEACVLISASKDRSRG